MNETSKTAPAFGESLAERKAARKPRLNAPERNQLVFETLNVETLIPEDHSARAVWDFVGKMDLESFYLKIKSVEGVAGRNTTDPRTMVSLWIYAYSRGVSSAREIERLCEYEPAFRWLTGMKGINHHSLSDFRIDNKEALDGLFVQALGLLSAENLITLERVMQDGTKIRANAGADSFRSEKRIQAHLDAAERHLSMMGDPTEGPSDDRTRKARERAGKDRLERLENALLELKKIREQKPDEESRQKTRASETDPESRIMKQADGGYRPSYNVQLSTDQAHDVIVAVDAVQEPNDTDQLLPGVENIQKNMGKLPLQMVADGGYTSRKSILKMHGKGVDFIGSMPDTSKTSKAQMEKRGIDPNFHPDAFIHDQDADVCVCPAGKTLHLQGRSKREGITDLYYRADAADCAACSFKDKCCPEGYAKGRLVTKKRNDPIVEAFMERVNTDEGKAAYRQRGPTAEFPNAWIKEKLGLRQFRLRGCQKVRIECVWACLTYNVQQWIRLRWKVPKALPIAG